MQKKIDELLVLNGKNRVWVGDPCYVISDDEWDDACEQIFAGTNKEVNHAIKLRKNLVFIQCGTEYGDGCYSGNSGFNYGVDAGCLAVVPEYLIASEKASDAERLGVFFDVEGCVRLKTDGKGIFTFSDNRGVFEEIYTGDF